MTYLTAFSKVLPVILLFLLGALFRRTGFLRPETIAELRKLIVNVTLPAVLFLAFSGVTLEGRHLLLVAIVFAACVAVLLVSRWIGPSLGLRSSYFPTLMTGFEAGMMGYAIFGAVYGSANIFRFAVVDLGQVLFVFFVLVPYVQRISSGAIPLAETVRRFIRTPVILAIFLGIVFNRLGVVPALREWPLTDAVLRTLELLAAMTTPLIGLIIGYEVRLQRGQLKLPARTVLLRLLVWVPLGLLLIALLVTPLLGDDPAFRAAVMTMFILPAPFVIPLYMGEASADDRAYVVNTLSLGTLVTMVAFTLISVLYPV